MTQMELVDTHCHLHDQSFFTPEQQAEAHSKARQDGVAMLCVGTDQADSRVAVEYAQAHEGTWAIVGVHPHEAKHGVADIGVLLIEKPAKVVGVGEIGLDYFYKHSSRQQQIAALEEQLQMAVDFDLPVSFHVREAFEDFWPIFDNFSGIRGVLHSFTDTQANADKALDRGLLIGINGISTFTKSAEQQAMFTGLPLSSVVLETDAPFLTPAPFRGKMNMPSLVGRVAEHLAALQNVPYLDVATATTANAKRLFSIN